MVDNSVSDSQENIKAKKTFSSNPHKPKEPSLRLNRIFCNILLFFSTLGVWGLFMQNMGFFVPNDDYTQKVRVVNTVDTEVQGSVNVNGSVAVYNTVGIDIKAINGHYNAFYGKKSTNGPYYGIPVETNW